MAEHKSLEAVLDEHFFSFLSLTKSYYNQIVEERDRKLCLQWLSKLIREKVQNVSEKRSRNIFFSHLLMNMQEGKITGPFLELPLDQPLPPASEVFGPQLHDDTPTSDLPMNFNNEMQMPEDFEERSADGRTYVAIRNLPNDRGTYAFVALNIDKDEADEADIKVAPCSIKKSKLRHLKALHKLSSSAISTGDNSEAQMEEFYIRNIEAKVSGDISQLYKSIDDPIDKPCGRNENEVECYNILLKQIDEEITGLTSGDNDLVKFLVRRLAQDLKKVPDMKSIFSLNPAQQNLKLLEILREKLIVRQQEEKRIILMAEMEETMLASMNRDTCMGVDDAPTEAMWKLAVTKPLQERDINSLYQAYPEEIIRVFLDLLSEDRQLILDQGRKRQETAIESMRSEVYKEIQSGKAKYNEVRAAYREWNEILSMVEELMYKSGNTMAVEGDPKKELVLANMLANIKETESLVLEEARIGEMLTEKVASANTWTYSSHDGRKTDTSWELKSATDNIRREIDRYKQLIERQEHRILELRSGLDYV